MSRTLFVQFEAHKWTEDDLDGLMETLSEETPDDVKPFAVPDDIEYLTEEQAESFMEMLADAIGGE